MSGSSDKYMDLSGSLKQESFDNKLHSDTIYDIFTKIMSSGIYKTEK